MVVFDAHNVQNDFFCCSSAHTDDCDEILAGGWEERTTAKRNADSLFSPSSLSYLAEPFLADTEPFVIDQV